MKTTVPETTAPSAVLACLLEKYLAGLMDPFISLLEVHKLMYFAQEAGEPLRLRYVKGPYGPYAENLRHVLAAVEGYLLSGYGGGGDGPDKPLELVPGAVDDARSCLEKHPATLAQFERVSRKQALTAHQIRRTARRLADGGWLSRPGEMPVH